MDNFRALKRKKQPKSKTQPRTKASGAKRSTAHFSLYPIDALTAKESRAPAWRRLSVPEATASFTEVDHPLSSAELPGEIQSLAKQGWQTQAVPWNTVLVPNTAYMAGVKHKDILASPPLGLITSSTSTGPGASPRSLGL